MLNKMFDGNPVCNERGNSTRTLLLVLLAVIAAGGYLFYFTDLIRPGQTAPPQPPQQTSQVKKPIPPRPDGSPAVQPGQQQVPASSASPVAPAAGVKPATSQPTEVAKKEAPKPASPAAVPAKPSPAPPVAQSKTPAPANVQAKAPAPAPQQAKTAAVAARPVAAGGKPAAGKGQTPADKKENVETRPKQMQRFTIVLTEKVPEKALKQTMEKLKNAGIAPVRKQVKTGAQTMNRVFIADFTEQDAAEAELQQLKAITGDAFMLVEKGKYQLYAGSYLTDAKLKSELQRLQSKGLKPVVKKAAVPLRLAVVSAGSFPSHAEADKALKKLAAQGLPGKVTPAGK